jgi:hypothetical protein
MTGGFTAEPSVYVRLPRRRRSPASLENTNGLLRQYLPRGTSFDKLRQHRCLGIAEKLNTRPRRRLGFYTPNEVYYGIKDPARDWAASCGKLFAPVLGSGPNRCISRRYYYCRTSKLKLFSVFIFRFFGDPVDTLEGLSPGGLNVCIIAFVSVE